jgi:hypothetical protein
MAAGFLAVLLWLLFAGVGAAFFYQRRRYRSRRRRGKARLGFYPSAAALGNALHTLQITAVPQIEHVMREKLEEPAEDDDSGDSEEDALRHLLRQAARLRRGERLDRLTAIWSRER